MITNFAILAIVVMKYVVPTTEDSVLESSSTRFHPLDITRLLEYAPPKRLKRPGNFKYISIQDAKDTFRLSTFSMCETDLAPLRCTCEEFQDISIIKNITQQTLSFVGVNPKTETIVVSYRPALRPFNFVRALDYKLINYPGTPGKVKVHRGFYKLMASTSERVHEAVEELLSNSNYENYSIKVAGYSLGASITTASIPDWMQFMSRNGYTNPISFYAYAGPRVGNRAFVNYVSQYNVPIMRYTHSDDAIVLFPSRKLGFVHAGVELYAPRKRPDGFVPEWKVCDLNYDEDPTCGLQDVKPIGFIDHIFPNATFIPSPYDCRNKPTRDTQTSLDFPDEFDT